MSWKIATIVKYLDQHIFLVKLLGDSREFTVHRSHLRVRQSWEDGEWFIVGKGRCAMLMKKNGTNANIQIGVGKSVKRKWASPVSLIKFESDNNSFPKTGLTEIGRSRKRMKQRFVEHPSLSSGKVDDYVYPQEKHGGIVVHSLLDVGKHNFSDSNLDMVKSNHFNQTSASPSRSCGTNSIASSVGSCSINDHIRYKNGSFDHDNLCSDAESSVGWSNYDGASCVKKNVELFEHRLELRLYCSALKKLYASGPLSWEDELKMVDLQDALHISNDEHLAEIKKLISTDTGILAC